MDTKTPRTELVSRWNRLRNCLSGFLPEIEGVFVFSRLTIYYFSGSLINGLLWIPLEGEPILLCRRGIERARIESGVGNIASFGSYSDIKPVFNELGYDYPARAGAEMGGLSWSLSRSLCRHTDGVTFVPADTLIAMTRSVKSEWELRIMREAGEKHNRAMTKILPRNLHGGMNELEISYMIQDIFNREGNHGILRMNAFGEEAFLGHTAIGDNANYPSVFNGPVGLRGAHPAVPFMGSAEIRWRTGQLLTIDNGFCLAGYQTDKTQVYWLGRKNDIPITARKAHDFCVSLQEGIVARLRPGALPSELWRQCSERAATSEWADGFMGCGHNQVPFVGHGIGLAIDEYPVLAEGFDLELQEGMVLAIEPKIGLPGIGMVGTENTFEVTPEGGKSLTGDHYDIICIEEG